MPLHDWTRVPPGIYHAFHLQWIATLSNTLNGGLLPSEYYALPEQVTSSGSPDVLCLHLKGDEDSNGVPEKNVSLTSVALKTRPHTQIIQTSELEQLRRKQNHVVIRHVSGDRIIAAIELVSPGNLGSDYTIKEFVNKACTYLERGVHLLILNPFPPGNRDPNGVHALIWESLHGATFEVPVDRPYTMVAYECEAITRAYIEPMALGDAFPEMPLFLKPDACVMVPVEATYFEAYSHFPPRWREVLEAT